MGALTVCSVHRGLFIALFICSVQFSFFSPPSLVLLSKEKEKGGDGVVEAKDDGHDCSPLPALEQSYLGELVFDMPAQSNFAAAGFGDFDGRASPESHEVRSSSSSSGGARTPSTGSYLSEADSITLAFSEPYRQPLASLNSAQAFFEETSGPGKRPRVEEIDDP